MGRINKTAFSIRGSAERAQIILWLRPKNGKILELILILLIISSSLSMDADSDDEMLADAEC